MTDAPRLAAIRQLVEYLKLGTPSAYIYVAPESIRSFTDLRSACTWLLEMLDVEVAARQQAEQARDFERRQHKRWVEIASKRAIEIEQLEDQIQDAKEAAEQQVTTLTQQNEELQAAYRETSVFLSKALDEATALRAALEQLIQATLLPEICAHDSEPDICDGCQFAMERAVTQARSKASAALAGSRAPTEEPEIKGS